MTSVTIPEAQQRLPELLTAAKDGEGVVIVREDGWQFRLAAIPPLPLPPVGKPKAGSCQGMIWMADDFDAPLDELCEYME